MQIPVKFYKVLNPPAEPATPNAVYLVQPDPEDVVDIYVTDGDGSLFNVGNAAFVLATIAPLLVKTATAPILLSSTVIDLNTVTPTKQSLFTVPSGRRAIVTQVDIDKLSAAPNAVEFTMGWDSLATDTLSPFHLSDLIDASTKFGSILVQPTSWLVGTAAQALGVAVSTPQGSALTARFNVFGYLTDTDGLPIANIL